MDRILRARLERIESRLDALEGKLPADIAENTADMCPDPTPYQVRHVGRGKYAVIGPDSRRVSDDLMGRDEAERLADERNLVEAA